MVPIGDAKDGCIRNSLFRITLNYLVYCSVFCMF